ncbi:MAG: hypothetical protein II802_03455, partial [Clostridia bacterium]|nr:hypothetical protein [Clostridia bacterium]
NDFREKINEYAINAEPSNPEIRIDCRIKPAALTVDLAFAIKELEPFGNGNPTPLFGIFSVVLTRILPIGSGKHLRLMFEKNGVPFQALLFSVTPEVFPFECGDTVDIAVNVDVNNYKNNISLSVIIKAMRISGVDEEKIILDKRTYDDFKSGYNCDTVSILPTRGEVGEIYKFVNSSLRSEDMILNRFISDMSVSKILVSIDTLKELGLINLSGNFYSAQKGVAKTDLKNSDTYAKLLRDGDI